MKLEELKRQVTIEEERLAKNTRLEQKEEKRRQTPTTAPPTENFAERRSHLERGGNRQQKMGTSA